MPRFDKLVVLDLDETLIHASLDADLVGRPPELKLDRYAIYRRPHLDEFLEAVFAQFAVAVWTSSSPLYAEYVVGWLGIRERLQFMWASDRCTYTFDRDNWRHVYLKPLSKILRAGYATKEKVLFVDDSPEKIKRSYGNFIRVAPFTGDLNDGELPALKTYLETLGPVPNVRRIEKRGWRNR